MVGQWRDDTEMRQVSRRGRVGLAHRSGGRLPRPAGAPAVRSRVASDPQDPRPERPLLLLVVPAESRLQLGEHALRDLLGRVLVVDCAGNASEHIGRVAKVEEMKTLEVTFRAAAHGPLDEWAVAARAWPVPGAVSGQIL